MNVDPHTNKQVGGGSGTWDPHGIAAHAMHDASITNSAPSNVKHTQNGLIIQYIRESAAEECLNVLDNFDGKLKKHV